MGKKQSIYLELTFIYAGFLMLAFIFTGTGISENLEKLFSMTTFLFAIILGFSTANRKQRLNSIRSLLRENDAHILSIHEGSKSFGKEVNHKVQALIDEMLVKQIDYYLTDFEKTTPELINLYTYCFEIKSNGKDNDYKSIITDGCQALLKNQKNIIYWVNDKIRSVEWMSLFSLYVVIIFCLYQLNDGSPLFMFLIPFISTSLALLFLMLRDIDNLSWQEESWIWNRLIELFQEIDLPPYFANALFQKNRINIKRLEMPSEYRVAEYPYPYPNMRDKKVTLVKD